MKVVPKKEKLRFKRRKKIRKKLIGSSESPRVSVFRSHKNIYVQLINDFEGKTIFGVSTSAKDIRSSAPKGGSVEAARLLGKKVAQEAKKNGFEKVIFDRGGYQYKGRVKALADALREEGLKV